VSEFLRDHPVFSLDQKQRILNDWYAFVSSGFKLEMLSEDLLSFFFDWWGAKRKSKKRFWNAFYGDNAAGIIDLIDLFSGEIKDRDDFNIYDYGIRLNSPICGDLNQAMIAFIQRHKNALLTAWRAYLGELAETDLAWQHLLHGRRDGADEIVPEAVDDYRAQVIADTDLFDVIVTDALRDMFAAAIRNERGRRPIRQPILFDQIRQRRRINTGGMAGQVSWSVRVSRWYPPLTNSGRMTASGEAKKQIKRGHQ
jgi:hypothetical protein